MFFAEESASSQRVGAKSSIRLACYDTQRLRARSRWTMLPALTVNAYLRDPLIVQGAVTVDLFEQWIEAKLLPQLTPGMIIVMDNASIHRSEVVRQLCLHQGVQLEFLPTCSPDLNPIQRSLNVLKAGPGGAVEWPISPETLLRSWRMRFSGRGGWRV